jgi:hypothetical protein
VLIGARSAAEVTDAIRLRALDIPAALWDTLAAAGDAHEMNVGGCPVSGFIARQNAVTWAG